MESFPVLEEDLQGIRAFQTELEQWRTRDLSPIDGGDSADAAAASSDLLSPHPDTAGDAAMAARLAAEDEDLMDATSKENPLYGQNSGGAKRLAAKPGEKAPGPDSLEGPVECVEASKPAAVKAQYRGSYYPRTTARHLELQSGSPAGRANALINHKHLPNGGPELLTLTTKTGNVYAYDTSPAACGYFGLRAGVRIDVPTSTGGTVVGVCDDHIWYQIDGDSVREGKKRDKRSVFSPYFFSFFSPGLF
jgi:hypothetical protein